MNQEEQNYLNLINNILTNGNERSDRTGVGTKSIFGTQLRFSLENDTLPLLTTKKVFFRGIVEELLFFLRGDTDTKKLEAKGINIWKGNTSREFLDKKGLLDLSEGDMGKGYGWQWRNFGGDNFNYVKGVDQIANVIKSLKEDPYSRRHIVSAWNPQQLNQMALPPCHAFFQFYVHNDELSCQWTQRSVDCGAGLPFNIASYGLLTHIIAKTVGLKAKEVIFSGGDTHCYLNHIDALKEQMKRVPNIFPTITINKKLTNIQDIENLRFEDFELKNYNPYSAIKMEMAI